MNTDQMNSAVRTLMKYIGAALATNGVVQHVDWNIVVGAIIGIGGGLWSWFAHRDADKPKVQ